MAKSNSKTKKDQASASTEQKPITDNHEGHQHDHQDHDHSKDSVLAANEKLVLTIKWTVVEKAYKKNLTQAAKNFKAEGFRVGKAPLSLVEQQVGSEKLTELTFQDVLPEVYKEAISKAEKKPITQPEFRPLTAKKGEDWQIEVHYASFPEINVKNYQKAVTIGNKTAAEFIKEREKQVKEDSQKAKDQKDTKSKPALKLTDNEKNEIRLQHIFKALVEQTEPKIPELLLRQETQAEFERLLKQLEQYQIKLEDYLKNRGITIETLSNELASGVLGRLQVDFILASISQEEKLKVAQEEINQALEKITNLKMRTEAKANQNYLTQLEANLLQKKTIDFLLKI